ncbi:hypothetical protein BO70DRAFT_361972 [Aspergillus heteromorphus CBS 117.55]|uniref:Uncharacterized protein n=1 Tax=Aspergillus heteromorphus CBS 117.55 TaxID=1448321 RepID=A0A317W8U4_9EURO|nr:uncharacterized protein BO70DRAFT_361972 [Aspergillus heteromorphus CBS 117.55]PWY83034.1 hypothetical protein BO70DRAFT_361972 [Aspergillus heteromorphus CBS 117.55]
MGSATSFAKTIIVPAVISLSLYLLFSFVIIPFFRRYHQRYSQYLPLHTISAHTTTLRDRIADALMRRFLPSSWRQSHLDDPSDNISIYDEEGEIMVGMDMDPSRREALERRRSSISAGAESRLSRELEAGFMDDSDEEGDRPQSRRGIL